MPAIFSIDQPDNGGSGEDTNQDCGGFYTYSQGGNAIYDDDCDNERYFVCEFWTWNSINMTNFRSLQFLYCIENDILWILVFLQACVLNQLR